MSTSISWFTVSSSSRAASIATSHFLKKRTKSSPSSLTCTCAASRPMWSVVPSHGGRASTYSRKGLYSGTKSDSITVCTSVLRAGPDSLHRRRHIEFTSRSVRSLKSSVPSGANSYLPVTVFLRKRPCRFRNASMSSTVTRPCPWAASASFRRVPRLRVPCSSVCW